MRKYCTGIIGLLLIMFYCSSCAILEGPEARETRKANRFIRKANRFIRKAEQHGAVWRSDTLFKRLGIKLGPVKVEFIPKPLVYNQPMLFENDSAKAEVTITPPVRPGAQPMVKVKTEYKERIVYRDVPVTVTRTIEAKKNNTGQWIAGILMALIAGCVAGYLLRGRHKVTVQIEKPPN